MKQLPAHIQSKIMPEPTSGCWLWAGATAGKNYGQITHDGKRQYAHRVVYELVVRSIPEGLEIDHLCKVTCCVNPNHLEPVTHKENLRRSDAVLKTKLWAASITVCPSGHEYTKENTAIYNGKRHCRLCAAIAGRKYDESNREKRKLAARAYRSANSCFSTPPTLRGRNV